MTSLVADARLVGGRLVVAWSLRGDLGQIVLPEIAERSERTDGLWKSTCFEAFVRPGPGAAYAEFNVSPSGDWAAYAFSGYREGMRNLPGHPMLGFSRAASDGDISVEAIFDLGGFPVGVLEAGITAVIETKDGAKSYWALAHPPGAPDFHHPDGFVLELAPV